MRTDRNKGCTLRKGLFHPYRWKLFRICGLWQGESAEELSVCSLVYGFVYSERPHLPSPCRALCRQAQHERTMTMNDVMNKEKQFEEAGKRRIVIDGTPYTVMVFFRTDTKETGMGKIIGLAKRELATNLLSE